MTCVHFWDWDVLILCSWIWFYTTQIGAFTNFKENVKNQFFCSSINQAYVFGGFRLPLHWYVGWVISHNNKITQMGVIEAPNVGLGVNLVLTTPLHYCEKKDNHWIFFVGRGLTPAVVQRGYLGPGPPLVHFNKK